MNSILLVLDPAFVKEDQLQRLRELAGAGGLLATDDSEQIERVLDDVEIIAGWSRKEYLLAAPKLRWYQQWGAGVDWLHRAQDIVELPSLLTNAAGVHAVPISEHILAMLLSLARQLPQARDAQSAQEWRRPAGESLFELADKTMLVIGFGPIGTRLAEVGVALGMSVLGIRWSPQKAVAGVERMGGFDQLLELLPQADFVALTTPLTPETQGFFSRRALAAMKPTAYLTNIGRGALIDERALVDFLQRGEIAGAALDVFENEPLSAESPFWRMDNVLITAHYAGASPRYNERAMALFLANLKRFQADEPLLNQIDKSLYRER